MLIGDEKYKKIIKQKHVNNNNTMLCILSNKPNITIAYIPCLLIKSHASFSLCGEDWMRDEETINGYGRYPIDIHDWDMLEISLNSK
jgi:hypothetical protein